MSSATIFLHYAFWPPYFQSFVYWRVFVLHSEQSPWKVKFSRFLEILFFVKYSHHVRGNSCKFLFILNAWVVFMVSWQAGSGTKSPLITFQIHIFHILACLFEEVLRSKNMHSDPPMHSDLPYLYKKFAVEEGSKVTKPDIWRIFKSGPNWA